MKLRSLFSGLVLAGAFTACSTNSHRSTISVEPGRSATTRVRPEIIPPGGRAVELAAAPGTVPEGRELRVLLEHSLVTGRNAHAFIELFARSDEKLQEFMELALLNKAYPVQPPAGIKPALTPDSPVQK